MTDMQNDRQSTLAAVQELSRSLHALVNDEQEFLDTELIRVSTLVKEGAEKLMDCFNEMHDLLQDQKRQLRISVAGASEGSSEFRNVEDALASTGQVNSYLGKAIIALQFEDIVQQLIHHSRQRIAAINAMLEMLDPHIDRLAAAGRDGQPDLDHLIDECARVVTLIRQRLETDHPVNQESLQQGTVTLF